MPGTGGRWPVVTAATDQVITNVGHTPQVVLILHSAHATEDVLESASGHLGLAAINVAHDRPRPYSMMAHTFWNGFVPASAYGWDLATWNRPLPGALYAEDMGVDDFTLRYSPTSGFNNSAGSMLYWLALSGPNPPELEHRRVYGFNAAIDEYETPFEPTTAFSIGSGSLSVDVGTIAYNDINIPTWAVWSKAPPDGSAIYDIFGGSAMNLAYGTNNAAFNSFWHSDWFTNSQWAYDQDLVLQTVKTGAFALSSDPTHMYASWHYPGGAWVGDYGRIGVVAMGGLLGQNNELVPPDTVGGEVTISCPFEIAAVVFMAGGYSDNPGGAANVKIGPSIGFCAANTRPGQDEGFQAVVAAGGQQRVSALRYQSSSRAWVSNYNGPGGSGIHAGTCLIEGTSFTLTCTEANRPALPIMYAALGFPIVDEPVIYRHGIRYR